MNKKTKSLIKLIRIAQHLFKNQEFLIKFILF